MKMLGQDLLTQQEFNEFHKNEFAPLIEQTQNAETAAKKSSSSVKLAIIGALIAVVLSIGSVVTVVMTMPK